MSNVIPLHTSKTKAQLEYELMVEVNRLNELFTRLEAECVLLRAWYKSTPGEIK